MKYLKQTLNQLEKNVGRKLINPEGDSYLIRTVSQLRDKPIVEFSIEDLRIMIGQCEGLKFLIPIAIQKLEENIFAEGDFYPGDLLRNVLQVPNSFWEHFPREKKEIKEMLLKNDTAFNNSDLSSSTGKKIKELITLFLK